MAGTGNPTLDLYAGGQYLQQHPDWHLKDATGKVVDLLPGVLAVIDRLDEPLLRLADVGAGVGGVVTKLTNRLAELRPSISTQAVAFEFSPAAVQAARELFPTLDIRQKFLEPSDGPFTAVLLVDVLEHLENPRELLRTVRSVSKYMIVRQPLVESFSTFRHKNYRGQRERWGHIAWFNYHSFLDMTFATGWKPLNIQLVAPWELGTGDGRATFISKMLVRSSREMASYFMSGFYLNGAFEQT